ncbi:MAG: beta-ketoacyl-ACP synthase II [Myxococcota bacterium]
MRRVVITGLGAVSPIGGTVPETWASVLAGKTGTAPITNFDAAGWKVQIAAEVKDFDHRGLLDRRDLKRMDRFTQFGVVAAHEAVVDAGLDPETPLGERAGVYVGSGIGGINEIEQGSITVAEKGPRGLSPFFIPRCLANLSAGFIAIRHGIQGPSLAISTACAVGNHSIGEAWRLIASNGADIVVAGGAEAPIVPVSIAGFSVMRALSTRNDAAESASRPFDATRDGFVMGEGAGILILESLAHAQARGARIYAEVIGYSLTTDAHHITAPPPRHGGAARCMRAALMTAGISPAAVGYINAHGTSTPANDLSEAQAISDVFGDAASGLFVSSTKSMTGHLLGAAGGLEAVLTTKALHHQVIPPTPTLQTVQPEIAALGLALPSAAQEAGVDVALSNAFGFGGTNASLVFRRWGAAG